MSIERATDTAVFLAYLDQVLIPELARSKPGAVVIRDNLSAHKRPAVRARLEAAGLELLRLPRYAPDLEPIEAMGSKVKEALRAAAARTVAALEAALATALARITAADARGFFHGCGYAAPANCYEICSRPGFPIWVPPTRPNPAGILAETRIPVFTRRVRRDPTISLQLSH